MTGQPPIIPLSPRGRLGVETLIEKSHAAPMDLNQVVPWRTGVDRQGVPKKMEHCWIYGTPWFDALTDAQRHEVLWLENARDVSMFILLEQTLPPLYMGYLNAHADALAPDVREYLMIFSKEEIMHTLMFRRYMKVARLPLFGAPDGLHEMLTVQLPKMHPVAGIIATLLLEWVAELSAMFVSQDDVVEPLTREMFYQHHLEEARHIAFGRWVGESFFEHAPDEQATQMRQMMRGLMARLVPQFTYNPEIARHTSFAFPIACGDQSAIDAVRYSERSLALNDRRFAPLYAWLRKVGVS
ncbi:hypothetical protein GPY61_10905 [Massilia sp. NEAU-DD11]|uniref:Diiron oxygenase n=1 Tax=Massilia cellulosiltytica TaxID=2683234 RepID=A0A7X3K7L2_9BURK|nr:MULTISPECIES: diiron oxygenase [Telluria group]KQZ34438.1 hypothetical protein ASD92_09070 [Massilia sp. Root1485]MVW60440.1 hypothetical protein [Telluria cellulosilytica]